MDLRLMIQKNNTQKEFLKRIFKDTKKEVYFEEFKSLNIINDILLKHLDYIKELVEMCYNESTFQEKFYTKYKECDSTIYIEKITLKKYNKYDYNEIILDTKLALEFEIVF